MRKYTKPIILVLIAAILGGVYLFANSRQAKTPDATKQQESGSIKFFEVDSQKVSEITVEKDSDKIVYQRKDKDFIVSYPADFKADSSRINSVVTNVSNLFVEKVVEENATDTAKYGFNKPIRVTVKYDGGVEEFEIGNMNSTKDSYYIRKKNNNKIYTVGTYTIQSIDVTKNDLRDRTLFTVKAEDIAGLSYKRNGSLVFTSKKSGEQWSLTEPIEANADATSMATIINAITQLTTYTSFVEDKPADLEKYGLKNPLYSLTFETASGKKTLHLGNDKTKGSEMYAMVDGTQQVITIDPTALTFLDKPLKEIVEVFAYIVNIQDVSKLVVDIDGKTTVSEIETNKDDSSKDKFTVDGKDANITDDKDNNLFKKYYQSIIGVTMSEIDTNYKPQGKAEITFTYTLKKDPGTMKVEFISRDANYYYVVRNGKYANIIVDKRVFDQDEGLRKTYKTLVDAMNKK